LSCIPNLWDAMPAETVINDAKKDWAVFLDGNSGKKIYSYVRRLCLPETRGDLT